jgi:hypothetical protein
MGPGGGQAGAPADDDHVPWSRPPWRGDRDLAGHGAGWPGGPARIPEPERAEARIRPERLTGSGRGEALKQPEAAEGLTKTAKEPQS